jgi:DnaJ-class molecular chaperone
VSKLAPLEITALSKIMDELDYYQILHLERDASASQIKRAFYSSSRTFHPDANRHLEAPLQSGCQRISKRLTEAYCVLRDPRRRKAYDQKLTAGEGGVRIQLAEAKAAHAKQHVETHQGKTHQGRQFFGKAMKELERGNRPGAISNLQMALTFEPDNALFKEKLESARKAPK